MPTEALSEGRRLPAACARSARSWGPASSTTSSSAKAASCPWSTTGTGERSLSVTEPSGFPLAARFRCQEPQAPSRADSRQNCYATMMSSGRSNVPTTWNELDRAHRLYEQESGKPEGSPDLVRRDRGPIMSRRVRHERRSRRSCCRCSRRRRRSPRTTPRTGRPRP